MYVRGTFGSWGCSSDYCFSRTGNDYSITLDSLSGNFKISDDSWGCEYGVGSDGIKDISASTTVTAAHGGENFNAVSLTNLTIPFTLNTDDYNAPINITFTVGDSATVQGLSGTLPVLYINVYTDDTHTAYDNEIISKDLNHKNYFSYSEYWLDINGCRWLADLGAEDVGTADEPLPLEIKARGNWTRTGFSKKPFKLKLGKKQSLLGLSKSKHFAILPHADDTYGYLRNFTGFNLGKRIGLPWTPSQQPVEVVINGDYRGLYFLTESIRVEEDRVNITELDDNATDPALISGGYLVELDNYDEDIQIQLDESYCVEGHHIDKLRITPDTPEEYSEIQTRFVTDQFTAMNNAVGACNDSLWSYMDLDDAARYYIVEEILCHTESYHGSTYLYRDNGENQKWHFSPLWDFGNAFSGATDMFFYDNDPYGNTWIPSMRTNDMFNDKVTATWKWFMSSCYSGVEDDINEYVSHISAAAVADRNRWKDQPIPDGGQAVADNSDMAGRCEAVLRHLNDKIAWLCQSFGEYADSTYSEPARDTTPAAPLPEYAQSGITPSIIADDEATPEFYTIEGISIQNPRKGNLYIIRRGTDVSKVIYR